MNNGKKIILFVLLFVPIVLRGYDEQLGRLHPFLGVVESEELNNYVNMSESAVDTAMLYFIILQLRGALKAAEQQESDRAQSLLTRVQENIKEIAQTDDGFGKLLGTLLPVATDAVAALLAGKTLSELRSFMPEGQGAASKELPVLEQRQQDEFGSLLSNTTQDDSANRALQMRLNSLRAGASTDSSAAPAVLESTAAHGQQYETILQQIKEALQLPNMASIDPASLTKESAEQKLLQVDTFLSLQVPIEKVIQQWHEFIQIQHALEQPGISNDQARIYQNKMNDMLGFFPMYFAAKDDKEVLQKYLQSLPKDERSFLSRHKGKIAAGLAATAAATALLMRQKGIGLRQVPGAARDVAGDALRNVWGYTGAPVINWWNKKPVGLTIDSTGVSLPSPSPQASEVQGLNLSSRASDLTEGQLLGLVVTGVRLAQSPANPDVGWIRWFLTKGVEFGSTAVQNAILTALTGYTMAQLQKLLKWLDEEEESAEEMSDEEKLAKLRMLRQAAEARAAQLKQQERLLGEQSGG